MVEEYKGRIVVPGAGEVVQARTDGASMTYQQFQQLELTEMLGLPQGTLLQKVPVGDLFTTVQELDAENAQKAIANFQGNSCITPIQAYRVILHDKMGVGLVSDHGSHTVGVAIVNGIKKVDVLLQPQELRPSGILMVRSIGELARQHQGILRMQPETVGCITSIELSDKPGLCFIKLSNRLASFPAKVIGLRNDGLLAFVGRSRKKDIFGVAKLPEYLANKLPPEIVKDQSIDLEG